jgi:hypothetical protein
MAVIITSARPSEHLRQEQFGEGRHVKITPASVGSHPMGKSPVSTGRHDAGPVNSKGVNLGVYAGKHSGEEKIPSQPKHASNAPERTVGHKDSLALRKTERGQGYQPRHAAGEQGTGKHAVGNKPKTQLALNEAHREAVTNPDRGTSRRKTRAVRSTVNAPGKAEKNLSASRHFNDAGMGHNEGFTHRILREMTGAA